VTHLDRASEFEIAIATSPAPEPEIPLELALIHALEDAGVVVPDRRVALEAIETALDDAAVVRAGQFLCFIYGRLGNGREGRKLRHALRLACEIPASEAEAVGIPRGNFWRSVMLLRRKLLKK
jgi:hypothetical protein